MTDKKTMRPQLWTERPVEETIAVYTDWADDYDKDVTERGYLTPARIADALTAFLPDTTARILDFGCGTGISGVALAARGYSNIDGTDITAEMLTKAEPKGIYKTLWTGEPGAQPAMPGTYDAIVAAGVVSLGAAPPETLSQLIDSLAKDGVIALSYNDPTLENGSYDAVLNDEVSKGRVQVVFREHGPHLKDMDMNSDVIVLKRL